MKRTKLTNSVHLRTSTSKCNQCSAASEGVDTKSAGPEDVVKPAARGANQFSVCPTDFGSRNYVEAKNAPCNSDIAGTDVRWHSDGSNTCGCQHPHLPAAARGFCGIVRSYRRRMVHAATTRVVPNCCWTRENSPGTGRPVLHDGIGGRTRERCDSFHAGPVPGRPPKEQTHGGMVWCV